MRNGGHDSRSSLILAGVLREVRPPFLKKASEAYETNWMSTVGANINEVERQVAELCGVPHAVALSSGTAALDTLR